MTVRLICWDTNEQGVQSIRDVKEQQLRLPLASLDLATIGRVREFLAALVRVLVTALAHPTIETCMPNDLVNFTPLRLVRSRSEDDFVRALSLPSRLGQYLPNPA